jgi:hypothetical protein
MSEGPGPTKANGYHLRLALRVGGLVLLVVGIIPFTVGHHLGLPDIKHLPLALGAAAVVSLLLGLCCVLLSEKPRRRSLCLVAALILVTLYVASCLVFSLLDWLPNH